MAFFTSFLVYLTDSFEKAFIHPLLNRRGRQREIGSPSNLLAFAGFFL